MIARCHPSQAQSAQNMALFYKSPNLGPGLQGFCVSPDRVNSLFKKVSKKLD